MCTTIEPLKRLKRVCRRFLKTSIMPNVSTHRWIMCLLMSLSYNSRCFNV